MASFFLRRRGFKTAFFPSATVSFFEKVRIECTSFPGFASRRWLSAFGRSSLIGRWSRFPPSTMVFPFAEKDAGSRR